VIYIIRHLIVEKSMRDLGFYHDVNEVFTVLECYIALICS